MLLLIRNPHVNDTFLGPQTAFFDLPPAGLHSTTLDMLIMIAEPQLLDNHYFRKFNWIQRSKESDSTSLISTCTFPAPSPPHPLCFNPEILLPPEIDPDTDDFLPDPLNDIPVPPHEDELLAPDCGGFEGDDYLRLAMPQSFLACMGEQASCPSYVCMAPSVC
jgi:hypothetical protein